MHRTESKHSPTPPSTINHTHMLNLKPQNKHTIRIGVYANVLLEFSSSYSVSTYYTLWLCIWKLPNTSAWLASWKTMLFSAQLKWHIASQILLCSSSPFLPAKPTSSHTEGTLPNSREICAEIHRTHCLGMPANRRTGYRLKKTGTTSRATKLRTCTQKHDWHGLQSYWQPLLSGADRWVRRFLKSLVNADCQSKHSLAWIESYSIVSELRMTDSLGAHMRSSRGHFCLLFSVKRIALKWLPHPSVPCLQPL